MDGATVFVLCLAGGLLCLVVYLAVISRRNASAAGGSLSGKGVEDENHSKEYGKRIA